MFNKQWVFGVTLLLPATAMSQVPPPPAAAEDAVQSGAAFVEQRGRGQASRAAALANAGRGANLTAMRSLVKASLRPRPSSLRLDAASMAELANQDAEAVAQFLALIGYGASDLAPGQASSREVVESAARIVLGRSDLADRVRVARQVVVAELTGVANDPGPADGLGSTASFRVVEAIKGDIANGATVQLRQRSGAAGNGDVVAYSTDFQPGQTGRFLLFVSDAAYEVRGRARGGRSGQSASTFVTSIMLPYEVAGEQVRPTSPDQENVASTLASVRAAAKQESAQ
jgi:hypothetical protein